MPDHTASRTLVKSTPELWAECSDAAALARHLGAFGEIRITKLEPETAVAWEGEDVCGTVTLEPSGWGTRVTLTATAEAATSQRGPASADPAPAAPAAAAPQLPAASPAPVAPAQRAVPVGVWARLRARLHRGGPTPLAAPVVPAGPPEPVAAAPAPAAPAPAAPAPAGPAFASAPAAEREDEPTVLHRALDSLGQAHRRPFSRN